MVTQYLQDEGFSLAACALQDESGVRIAADNTHKERLRKLRQAVLCTVCVHTVPSLLLGWCCYHAPTSPYVHVSLLVLSYLSQLANG